ncbi:N-carbamoyl-D-amino-acid hydrolase [Spinactinospora alkalitolerans]
MVARLVDLMRRAKDKGASFVVFPELALTTFFPRYWQESTDAMDRYFERSMPSRETIALFECARDLRIGFSLGYAELTPEGRRHNTSVIVDEAGEIRGRYRKIHLPGHADRWEGAPFQHLEKRYFEVGDLGLGVFPAAGTRIGMCLCNDRRWPEVYRVLALQSAELVVLGYNTPTEVPGWREEPHAKMFTHLLSLQAGAYQNSVWVAAAGKSGTEDGQHLIGGSAIVAPSGEIVAKASTEGDELVYCDIDLDMAAPYRSGVFDFEAHRRPEEYTLITERKGRGEPLPRPEGSAGGP